MFVIAINDYLSVPAGSIGTVLEPFCNDEVVYDYDDFGVGYRIWRPKSVEKTPTQIHVDFGNGFVFWVHHLSVWAFDHFPTKATILRRHWKYNKNICTSQQDEWPEEALNKYFLGLARGPRLPSKYKMLYNITRQHGINPADFVFEVRFDGVYFPLFASSPEYSIFCFNGRWAIFHKDDPALYAGWPPVITKERICNPYNTLKQ